MLAKLIAHAPTRDEAQRDDPPLRVLGAGREEPDLVDIATVHQLVQAEQSLPGGVVEVLGTADVADHHFPGVQADACAQRHITLAAVEMFKILLK